MGSGEVAIVALSTMISLKVTFSDGLGGGLADEEHLAILGQGPKLVVDDELEFVHVVADAFDEGRHIVVIGNCLLRFIGDAVGHTSRVDELVDVLCDEGRVV